MRSKPWEEFEYIFGYKQTTFAKRHGLKANAEHEAESIADRYQHLINQSLGKVIGRKINF